MAGKKRSVNGQVKPQASPQKPPEDMVMTDATPTCGQPQPPSSKTCSTPTTARKGNKDSLNPTPQEGQVPQSAKPAPQSRKSTNRKKLAKLPKHASISTRPLLHPALPTPHSSSASPKIIYITATTPHIPCAKRVRKLLADITKREKQSAASLASRARGGPHGATGPEANGRLEAKDVERNVAEEASKKGGARKAGEMVYLKATGRAIARALEIGLMFQADEGCRITVDLGSVKAVDDIELKGTLSTGGDDDAAEPQAQGQTEADEDIPETRIRTVSSVTVSIGLA